ncbi:hypothetical protein BASA50_010852 [Batrachochytrium salamandrivorans]|uniref:Uncharacterized protein n=1 Tax=Batrachochytrium salamandrivorans TaxID=1357716 RepID=A0ABQ8EXJ6_9FUNG|nr:hypothetical protein BASA62_004726 [Batrachochytrium salamandrivorans]KAH6588301.1 hypothetical protein BASA50_010852 [Batrachochytrium salamandrivorans]
MQFLHLFSFVVVASYAAALPQPAGLSEKYSNDVDTNSASGLEARSYQPGSNLVSLKQRGNSGSGSSPSSPSDPQNLVFETNSPFGKAHYSALLLFDVVKAFGTDLGDAPKNVKAAGAALSDSTGKLLVDYAQRSLQAVDALNNWVKDAEQNLFGAIKAGLGNKRYSKIKPLLDDASSKLAADASYNLQQVTAALSNIEKKIDSAKLEVEAVQQSFGRVFEDYQFYIKTLRPHLDKFSSGQETNAYLSEGVEVLVEFSLKQEALYFAVRNGIPDAIY